MNLCPKKQPPATSEASASLPVEKAEFIYLESLRHEYESRKVAADNRAYVLSVFSAAQMVLLLQQGTQLHNNIPDTYRQVLYATCVGLALMALVLNLNLVLPVRRKRSIRRSEASSPGPQGLTWFWHVSRLTPVELREAFRSRSRSEQTDLLYGQVVGMASMLAKRYRDSIRAGKWLRASLLTTVGSVLLNQFWPNLTSIIQDTLPKSG